MAEEKSVSTTVKNASFISNIIKQFRLAWLLFQDRRVSLWVKSIIPVSLIYVISPIDLIPLIPVAGQLDDLGVIFLGLTTFIKLCPPHIVQYYQRQIETDLGQVVNKKEIIDTPYRVVDKK